MPVSGLVITLKGGAGERRATIDTIAGNDAFTVGKRTGRWLPIAMEAIDDGESRQLHDWLMSLPGVAFVDVVSVNFDESSLAEQNDETNPVQ